MSKASWNFVAVNPVKNHPKQGDERKISDAFGPFLHFLTFKPF